MKSLSATIDELINNKTKPLGALGMLELVAKQVAMIQDTLYPTIQQPHIIVFAGDHGIAATGLINPYPQAVTAQMVLNFVAGGAAINVFCKQHQIGLTIVDAGVNTHFDKSLPIIHAAIKKGTANYLHGVAMKKVEVQYALEKGKSIVQLQHQTGCNTIGFGEMGIGNTSAASLIMSNFTGIPIKDCIGRGTGSNNEQLQTKMQVLQEVFTKHGLKELNNEPIELLSRIGGFEIAMMTGAFLEAARLKMVIIVDGFIATAALLVALQLNSTLLPYCIFAHTSGEQGHEKMLQYLKVQPLLQLGMRLGEGTGAALAIPLVQSAVHFLKEMSSFEQAAVSGGSINSEGSSAPIFISS